MAVNLSAPTELLPVQGVRLATAAAGIKKADRQDLLLIELAPETQVAGVFTRNAFCAAPVRYCQQRMREGRPIAGLLINSGNANAGTGRAGAEAAARTAERAAALLQRPDAAVLPFSTGVIGVPLPVPKLLDALPAAVAGLASENWLGAAQAIMTTDTVAKGISRQVETAAGTVTVTGIAKGAGMIRPDMATMLAFIACDANVPADGLQRMLQRVTAASFNSVTVDGDTSTNDAAILMATGKVGGQPLSEPDADFAAVEAVVLEVCQYLAQAMVRDGEGAKRFIELEVRGARSVEEARQVAYTIAHSPLVKTACFAGDANWGRILAAVGRSGLPDLDVSSIDIKIDDVALIEQGEPHPEYTEAAGATVFAKDEYRIGISLGRGDQQATIWTCDLGYEYVRINADYRT